VRRRPILICPVQGTRGRRTPVTLPEGWNLSECVAVTIKAMIDGIHNVETPLQRSNAVDNMAQSAPASEPA
jgi:hypothetical protein